MHALDYATRNSTMARSLRDSVTTRQVVLGLMSREIADGKKRIGNKASKSIDQDRIC